MCCFWGPVTSGLIGAFQSCRGLGMFILECRFQPVSQQWTQWVEYPLNRHIDVFLDRKTSFGVLHFRAGSGGCWHLGC
jgi:hypothetical protein